MFFVAISCHVMAGSQASLTAIDITENDSPRGYWQFLPSVYETMPEKKLPIVIFFHGLGEGGNGTTELDKLLDIVPVKLVNNDIDNNVFELNEAIMLAPQLTAGVWWNDAHIRRFFDFVLSSYGERIDHKRIYFTGLSAGSSGINDFIDDDVEAQQITAALVVAVRGVVSLEGGGYLAPMMPYWGLTARGDASNTLIRSVNNLAGFIQNNNVTDVMANYPNGDITRTAVHHPDDGWLWREGVDAISAVNPKMTLYPGSNHNTWDITYANDGVWSWLFDQQKPDLNINSPMINDMFMSSQAIKLSGTAADKMGHVIDNISWSSSIDGFLGTGANLQVMLSTGIHQIEAVVVDEYFTGHIKSINIEIVDQLPDLIFTDGFES